MQMSGPISPQLSQFHVSCVFCKRDMTVSFNSGSIPKWFEVDSQLLPTCVKCLQLVELYGDWTWLLKEGLTLSGDLVSIPLNNVDWTLAV